MEVALHQELKKNFDTGMICMYDRRSKASKAKWSKTGACMISYD